MNTMAQFCNEHASKILQAAVDNVYSEACSLGGSYEQAVHDHFCSLLRKYYPNVSDETHEVFVYASKRYGYQTFEEATTSKADYWDNGICTHGLEFMTCPAGCFETP